jgi:hypothetical protein
MASLARRRVAGAMWESVDSFCGLDLGPLPGSRPNRTGGLLRVWGVCLDERKA